MEVIQLTNTYHVVHCSATELETDIALRSLLVNLYRLVFKKEEKIVSELINWHITIPGESHYFLAIQDGTAIAFNYFLKFEGMHGLTYALSGGSMVLPSQKGSFIPLFQTGQRKLFEQTDFLMGFCNQNSLPVLCHPVVGWRKLPEFCQVSLISFKQRIFDDSNYVNYKGDFDFNNSLTILTRSKEFLKWRLSRIKEYQILRNNYTGNVIVYKLFEEGVDLITVLGCDVEQDYWHEVALFFSYIMGSDPAIGGINLFVSSKIGLEYIENHFNYLLNNYPRYFCLIQADNNNTPYTYFSEMIDSDTF